MAQITRDWYLSFSPFSFNFPFSTFTCTPSGCEGVVSLAYFLRLIVAQAQALTKWQGWG